MADTRAALRQIARLAITEMSEADRAGLIAEYLVEFSGPDAIANLSRVRAAIGHRMQELIDEKFPLHETAQVYGDLPAVHARATAGVDSASNGGETSVRMRSVPGRIRSKAKEPFVPAARMAELRAARRHGHVESCKEILKVIHLVEQGRVAQKPDLLLDQAAERLAGLIFGETFDDCH